MNTPRVIYCQYCNMPDSIGPSGEAFENCNCHLYANEMDTVQRQYWRDKDDEICEKHDKYIEDRLNDEGWNRHEDLRYANIPVFPSSSVK